MPPKRSKMSTALNTSVPTVIDYFDLTKSKRVTTVVPSNVPPANNITISNITNAKSRILPNWKRKGNCSNPENGRRMAHGVWKKKTTSWCTGTVKPCKTRELTCPTWYAPPLPTATNSFVSRVPPASRTFWFGWGYCLTIPKGSILTSSWMCFTESTCARPNRQISQGFALLHRRWIHCVRLSPRVPLFVFTTV